MLKQLESNKKTTNLTSKLHLNFFKIRLPIYELPGIKSTLI